MPHRAASDPIANDAFAQPRGIAENFGDVRDLSMEIARQAADFRALASRLGALVAALDD